MKYLKLFETESEYQAYVDSGEMILPNVSFIREIKRCGFKPYVDVTPKVTLNYNSTEDNLFAFSNGSLNIKALKIDGKNIEFPPIVTDTSTVEILASEVSYNAETELYEFPDNYSITSVPTSLVIKPKDSSIKVTDANIGCVAFISYEGMKMCEPMPLSDVEGVIVIDEVNNQITFTDLFLQEMGNVISMGYGYGFGLCNIIDLDSYQFDIIDSIQIYEGTSGGIVTPYYFETPGTHTVEMELLNGDFGQMYMFYNPLTEESATLTSVIFNKNITSISQYTFIGNGILSEITCESEIAPAINYSFVGIRNFGTLHYPEGSDYSSWLEGEGSLFEYGWNKEQPILTAKYNITDTTSPTALCYDTSNFTDIIIDGTPISPLEDSYTFSTTGEHEVIYKLNGISIGNNAFQYCSGLTAITIPDGVTEIGGNAFYGCSGLTEITLGNGVTSIGYSAFAYCSKLTAITCNATIAPTIHSNTFHGVKKYGTLHYPEGSDYSSWLESEDSLLFTYRWNKEEPILTAKYNITDTTSPTALYNDTSVFTIFVDIIIDGTPMSQLENSYTFSTTGEHEVIYKLDGTSIGYSAFKNCSGLTEITLSNGVTEIGAWAFENCSGLKGELVIPDSVTSIDNYAFYGCSGLTAITIPDGVTEIGEGVFNKCSSLTSITIPDSVTNIKWVAFGSCSGLTEITLGNGVTEIGGSAFAGCSGLTEITIPDSVTSIGDGAFQQCSGLTEITLGNGVTEIGERAFFDCYKLTEITIPDGVTEIGEGVFYGCSGLKGELVIPDSVTSIGRLAFAGCSGLTSISLGNGVTSIDDNAFQGCDGLTEITLGNGVTEIGEHVFISCSKLTAITCNATIAPTINNLTFNRIKNNGTLYIPSGSDYSSWLSSDANYLGYYNWTVEYI